MRCYRSTFVDADVVVESRGERSRAVWESGRRNGWRGELIGVGGAHAGQPER